MSETFEVEGVKYKVRKPTNEEYREAKKIENRAFNDALKSDSPLRSEVTKILTERGLWSEQKGKEMESLYKDIDDQEFVLKKRGIKKSEARVVCLKLRSLRNKLNELLVPVTDFNKHTAEGQADNARFDYLASCCIVKEDGSPYFTSHEDYLDKDEDRVAIMGSRKFASIYYGLRENYEAGLIENQVLKELKFANDEFKLIDAKGRLINEDGHLIDKDGRLIDENGGFVNVWGRKVDENGELIVEVGVFIDDDEADIKKDSAPS